MYKNIGAKIKALAKDIFIFGSIAAIVVGIMRIIDTEEPMYILLCIVGPIVAWISSWLLYAFGEMVEDIHALRVRIAPSSEQDAIDEAERKAKEQAAIEKAKQEAEKAIIAHNAAEKIKQAQENTDRDSLKKDFDSIPSMDKPTDFIPNKNWDIDTLTTKQLVEKYMNDGDWSESYRYACYLELKKRIG